MLAMHGVSLSYETVYEWCLKFGHAYATGCGRSGATGSKLEFRLKSEPTISDRVLLDFGRVSKTAQRPR